MEVPNDKIVLDAFPKNVEKIKKAGFTHMKCSSSGKVLPLDDFRIHGKYYMSYSKAEENKAARKARNPKTRYKEKE